MSCCQLTSLFPSTCAFSISASRSFSFSLSQPSVPLSLILTLAHALYPTHSFLLSPTLSAHLSLIPPYSLPCSLPFSLTQLPPSLSLSLSLSLFLVQSPVSFSLLMSPSIIFPSSLSLILHFSAKLCPLFLLHSLSQLVKFFSQFIYSYLSIFTICLPGRGINRRRILILSPSFYPFFYFPETTQFTPKRPEYTNNFAISGLYFAACLLLLSASL